MVDFIISEKTVVTVILINTIALFLGAFPEINAITQGILTWIDYACVIFFIIEALVKMSVFDYDEYWNNGWNRFDLWVILLSIPTLLEPFYEVRIFSVVLVLRLSRIIRFFKLLKFVPDGEKILIGVRRALKASVAVFLTLALLNLFFGMLATTFFSKLAPEYFGNPLSSCFALFKVSTLENWSDYPSLISSRAGSSAMVLFSHLYFCVIVIVGILGFSLANAVFVDEMTADNTAQVEKLVETLRREMQSFRDENQNDRQLSNEKLKSELKAFRDENQARREESNEKIHAEIAEICKTLKSLTASK